MRKLYSVCISVFCCLAFVSCAPRVYLPDRVNAPMLREQGDVKLTSSFKVQGNGNTNKFVASPSFDFAASPINGLGLMVSYRHTNRYADEDNIFDSVTDPDSIHYSGNKLEMGAGYYMPFGGKGLFEIYAGGGFGSFNRDNIKKEPYADGNFQSRYQTYFLQPALGFCHRDIIELSGGIRFAYLKYNHFRGDDSVIRYELTDPESDIEKNTFIFIDPYVNVNIGYRYAKFNIQMGSNICVSSPQLRHGDFPFYASLGLTLEIAPRFAGKKK
ncbi:hypothetical protein ACTHGU_11875 [Chitinophagaceae bacterium MMS25-I14]